MNTRPTMKERDMDAMLIAQEIADLQEENAHLRRLNAKLEAALAKINERRHEIERRPELVSPADAVYMGKVAKEALQ